MQRVSISSSSGTLNKKGVSEVGTTWQNMKGGAGQRLLET
jgi:hypothetical protein